MNKIRTVSDTKRAFYSIHTRPVNSIYRRVVEELMVEMHLLKVNADFQYDPIYALGVVTAFDRFMAGYIPETDKESIFNALIQAQQEDPQQYRAEATRIEELAKSLSIETVTTWAEQAETPNEGNELQQLFHAIATRPKFKYSRLFAIGLYRLLEQINPEVLENKEAREKAFSAVATGLNIPQDKLLKDLELYRSNLDKMVQTQILMKEITEAERKKRAERAQKIADTASSESSTPTNSDA
ncbi:MAG: photosystem II biogenesis protein Psp29 [Microcoleaceae cyanobacterium]